MKRPCTLLAGVRIERGSIADWRRLAALHYRGHHPGAVTDVFRLVYAPPPARRPMPGAGAPCAAQARRRNAPLGPVSPARLRAGRRRPRLNGPGRACGESLIGVIVYARSPLSLAARNRATGGRYRLGRLGRVALGDLVNRELRIISRVVIAPNWRGLGLASRLVAETLPQVGTPYVEALAAMGRVHPFFEQAGMTAYPGRAPPQGERLRACLEAVGIAESDRGSPARFLAAIEALAAGPRRLVEAELARWARSYLGAKNHRTNTPPLDRMAELVARHLGSAPTYYLWRRAPRTGRPDEAGRA